MKLRHLNTDIIIPDNSIQELGSLSVIGNGYSDKTKTWNEVYLQNMLSLEERISRLENPPFIREVNFVKDQPIIIEAKQLLSASYRMTDLVLHSSLTSGKSGGLTTHTLTFSPENQPLKVEGGINNSANPFSFSVNYQGKILASTSYSVVSSSPYRKSLTLPSYSFVPLEPFEVVFTTNTSYYNISAFLYSGLEYLTPLPPATSYSYKQYSDRVEILPLITKEKIRLWLI